MKKIWIVFICFLFSVVLISGTVIALAASGSSSVGKGEMLEGDLIYGSNDKVFNEGKIRGDFIALAAEVASSGEVEGDLMAAASKISADGVIGGNIRAAGREVNINCPVGKNVMIYGSNIAIGEEAVIGRNAYLSGDVVNASGKVMGDTTITAGKVILGGVYEGDVTIKNNNSLEVIPGTVIRGELIYEGTAGDSIPSGIRSRIYSSAAPVSPAPARRQGITLWGIIKKIFTLLAYYLVALLLYKIFPRFFARSGRIIEASPLASAGIGIAAFGTLVVGCLALIFIILLALLIFNISVFIFSILMIVIAAAVTIFFADIPVSMWIGDKLAGRNKSVPARLAAGLALISGIKLVMDILKAISAISSFARVISSIINIAIWLLGTGALMKSIYEMVRSANMQAETEETRAEEFSADMQQ